MNLRAIPAALALAIVVSPVLAEESNGAADLGVGTRAEPLERPKANYPGSELARGAEGWVEVCFSITAEGNVSDIIINDLVGPKAFASSAIATMKSWKYKPATWQGQPVPQLNNYISMTFALRPLRPGASSRRVREYKEIRAMIAAGNLVEADQRLDTIFEQDLNLYELAFFNMQRAAIAHLEKEYGTESYYLRRVSTAERLIGQKASRSVMSKLFVAHVNARQYATALHVYEELAQEQASIENWQELEEIHAQLIQARDGNQPYYTEGTVRETQDPATGHWYQQLLKRSIEFSDINGELDRFEFRCDKKVFTDKITSGKNWSVPDEWGACSIYVYGKPGTTFKLFEMPKSS